MISTGKVVIRIIFALCLVLLLFTDYTGFVHNIIGENRTEQSEKLPPKPRNPGYGDPKTDIHIDADIEDDTIKRLGKRAKIYFGALNI